MGRPRRPETGKGIGDGESPAKEEKWWGRAQNGVLLLNLGFFL